VHNVDGSQISSFVRELFRVTEGRYVLAANQREFSSMKEAQAFAWSAYCRDHRLTDAEREAVKNDVFDEVARYGAMVSFASVWGFEKRS
jgi:hypothetical protein